MIVKAVNNKQDLLKCFTDAELNKELIRRGVAHESNESDLDMFLQSISKKESELTSIEHDQLSAIHEYLTKDFSNDYITNIS